MVSLIAYLYACILAYKYLKLSGSSGEEIKIWLAHFLPALILPLKKAKPARFC